MLIHRILLSAFLLLVWSLWIPATAIGKGYHIQIQITGAPEGTAILAHYYGHTNQIQDSSVLDKGRFVFEGETPLPAGMYVVVLPGNQLYFDLIVDEDQEFSIQTDTADLVRFMEIKGSKENSAFYNHSRFLGEQTLWANRIREQLNQGPDSSQAEQLLATLSQINQGVEETQAQFYERHPDLFASKLFQNMSPPKLPDYLADAEGYEAFYYYRKQLLEETDFGDERLLRSPALFRKVNQYLEEMTPKQADSIIQAIDIILLQAKANPEVFKYFCSYLLNKYAELSNQIMDMDRVYVHIVETYYASGEAYWVDEELMKNILTRTDGISRALINRPGADLIAPDSAGIPRNLYGVQGKLTVLYIWSYQCGHCKEATPVLVDLYRQYEDRGLGLYTLNTEGTEKEWKAKLQEYGFGGTHVFDPYGRSGYHQKYDSHLTPTIYILDENKIIKYKRISVEQLGEILERELGE